MYATECEWLSEGMEVSPLLPLCSCWDWNYVMATALARRDLSPRGSWKHFPSLALWADSVSTTHCICSAAQIRGWVWSGSRAHHGNMYGGWKLRVCIPGFWHLLVIYLFLRQNLSMYYKLIWSLSCQFWDYRSATLWPPGKLLFTLFSKGMPFSVAFIATRYVVTLSIKCTKGKSVRNKID